MDISFGLPTPRNHSLPGDEGRLKRCARRTVYIPPLRPCSEGGEAGSGGDLSLNGTEAGPVLWGFAGLGGQRGPMSAQEAAL